jgi:hypothetical protein
MGSFKGSVMGSPVAVLRAGALIMPGHPGNSLRPAASAAANPAIA